MGVLKNLALGYVDTPPSPAGSGTSLVLGAGEGARFANPTTYGSYFITIAPSGEDPHIGNSEICLLTGISTDTLTITREQKGTSARTIIAGDRVFQGIYSEDGDIDLAENLGIVLDSALSADGKYSGIVEAGTAGATLAFGDLCYFNNNDSRWELVNANLSDGYDKKLGICVLAAGADGNATKMLLWGKVRADTAFPTLTIGAPVYMSETAGDITTTAPTTADVAIRVIGQGNTADELFFNPSPDCFVHQ